MTRIYDVYIKRQGRLGTYIGFRGAVSTMTSIIGVKLCGGKGFELCSETKVFVW